MRRQEGADLEQQWTDDVAGENAGTWFTRRHLTLLDTAVCAAGARRVIYTTTTTSSNHHQQLQTQLHLVLFATGNALEHNVARVKMCVLHDSL